MKEYTMYQCVKGLSKKVALLCRRAFKSGYDQGFMIGKEAQLEDITEHINNFLVEEYDIPTDLLEMLKRVYNMGTSDGRNSAINTIEYYTEERGIAQAARPSSSSLLKAWKGTYDAGYNAGHNDGYAEGFNNGNAYPEETINDMVASEMRDMVYTLYKLNDGEVGYNDVDAILYDVYADIHDKAYAEGLDNGAEEGQDAALQSIIDCAKSMLSSK